MTEYLATNAARRFARVIPGYREIFGHQATRAELLTIVRRHPVFAWLSFLSRIHNMLWGLRANDPDFMRAVFAGALSAEIRQRLTAFAEQKHVASEYDLFYERQISSLQQLVILNAPESGIDAFETEEGRHDLGCALLMTMDVLDEGRSHARGDVLAAMVQDHVHTKTTPPEQFAARAYWLYELSEANPTQEITEYLHLHEVATKVNARHAIVGTVLQVIREYVADPKDIAAGWQPVAHPDKCENALEGRVVQASRAGRWGTIERVRAAIRAHEQDRPPRDWNLIALSQFPIIDFGERCAFVVNHTALGRSLFDGVRHAVLTAAIDGRLPPPYSNEKAVGRLYGRIFQNYVGRILRRIVPDRVIDIPECSEQRCDFLVWFPEKVVLVEVKAEHFTARTHATYMTLEQRYDELRRIGIAKAAAQLSSTIRALRAGRLGVHGLPNFDWTITPIVPLVITEESLPRVTGLWNRLYEPFDRPFDNQRAAGPIGTLRLLSIDELEYLPDLDPSQDLAGLLYRWGCDPTMREYAWFTFAEAQEIRPRRNFVGSQYFDLSCHICDLLGLDRNELRRPSSRDS